MSRLNPGDLLADYSITAYIGSGAAAEVYHAQHTQTGAAVALKIMLPGMLAQSQEFEERFRREAHLLQSFQHPHILPVYDQGRDQLYYYLAMKLVDGGSLEERIHQTGGLPLADTRRVLDGVASALDYVHHRGVIHRDMKPSNILLDQGSYPYIADFGIAKVQDMVGITSPGTVLGSIPYMAPEKMNSDGFDHRIDVFALGLITFETLLGKLPIKEKTPLAYFRRYVMEDLPVAEQLAPLIGAAAAQVVQRAVQRNPDARYATAGEFAHDFLAATAG